MDLRSEVALVDSSWAEDEVVHHATHLLARGEELKMVSERLGHASPVVTMTVYAHVLPGRQRQAAERFAAAIEEGRS